jgi:23S rRNA pseudouridine1911/1915/1917 synthase
MPEPREGTIDAAVSNRYVSGRRHLVSRDSQGRSAVTHYRVCEGFDGVTLVELRLETGRQHQIRLHMERLGHPLVGERVYVGAGAAGRAGGVRQMLHAWRLAFSHPLTGELIRVEAPLPDDFERTLRRFRQ